MRLGSFVIASALVLGISPQATAAVLYHFEFTNLNSPIPDFAISLQYDDYVQTSGMTPTAPIATPVGVISHVGTNNLGWWGFGQGNANIADSGFFYGAIPSFLFQPNDPVVGYITAPGTYLGTVSGNQEVFIPPCCVFGGTAVLTVSQVPEPGTLALIGSAMLAGVLRRRYRRSRGL